MAVNLGTRRNYACIKTSSIWDIDDENIKPLIYYSKIDREKKIIPAKSFEELRLNEELVKGLHHCKIFNPENVQQYILPLLIRETGREEDVLIYAARQSRKSISVLIALLQLFSLSFNKLLKALIICPTRELADQTFAIGNKMAEFMKVSFQLEMGKKGCKNGNIFEQIIVSTPKKLENLIKSKLLDVKNVGFVILDDIQSLLPNKGHESSLIQILSQVPESCRLISICSTPPKKFQCMYNDLMDKLINKRYHPLIVEFPISEASPSNIKPYFVSCSDIKAKMKYLLSIIVNKISLQHQIIIICENRETINNLYSYLEEVGFSVSSVTAKLPLDKQQSIIKDFKDGKIKVLIITRSIKDLKTDSLMTLINFDHYINLNEKTVELDMESYGEWMKIIPNREGKLYINFVDKRYAQYVLKTIPEENVCNEETILDEKRLTQLCS